MATNIAHELGLAPGSRYLFTTNDGNSTAGAFVRLLVDGSAIVPLAVEVKTDFLADKTTKVAWHAIVAWREVA